MWKTAAYSILMVNVVSLGKLETAVLILQCGVPLSLSILKEQKQLCTLHPDVSSPHKVLFTVIVINVKTAAYLASRVSGCVFRQSWNCCSYFTLLSLLTGLDHVHGGRNADRRDPWGSVPAHSNLQLGWLPRNLHSPEPPHQTWLLLRPPKWDCYLRSPSLVPFAGGKREQLLGWRAALLP